MSYASIGAPGAALAATSLATGQMWPVVVSAVLVLTGVLAVRLTFRRGRGPVEK